MTTATEFTVPDHGKIVHIYRNGDIFFSPKKFVVNKRNRSFDSFLNDVTAGLRPPFGAVRRLHTPVNGHKVSHLEEMVSGQRYVAVGNERFKRLGYESIPEGGIFKKPAGPITPRENDQIKPVVHSRLKTSGRIRKIRNDPTTIFIYANGDILRNAVRVLFKKRELQSWDQTLSAIADRITLRTGAVRWLYTLDGTLVEDVGSLKNAEFYVGVGTERFYKELIPHYGQHPALQLSPRSERRKYLPPIIKPRRAKRKSNQTSENSGSLDNSLNSNKSKQRHKKTENEEDTVFHAKPVKHKRSSEKSRPVDYDKDDGGVYKAKQNNTETSGAAQVEESRDTRTELPIDQVPAEEVKEDVDENENKRKSKDHNSPVPDNKTSNNEPDNELENKNSTPNAKSPTDQPEAEKKSSTPANEDLNDVIEQQASGDNQTNDKRSSTPDQAKPDPATGTGDAPPQETSKDEAVEEEKNPAKEEDTAASKIQAGVRGYQTRKKVKQKRKNENAAATTIQAGYRGYQTRRDLKQNDSTADPEGSQSKPE